MTNLRELFNYRELPFLVMDDLDLQKLTSTLAELSVKNMENGVEDMTTYELYILANQEQTRRYDYGGYTEEELKSSLDDCKPEEEKRLKQELARYLFITGKIQL